MQHLGGAWYVAFLLFMMASANVGAIITNIWIATWSAQPADEQTKPIYRNVLLGLVAFTVVAAFIRSLLSFDALVRAAHTLHNGMLRAVVRAPVLFFDSNPIGRILNRFSKDGECA
jgi:ATP-binding cassette subfamily C (CFTR/MRP) protein 1